VAGLCLVAILGDAVTGRAYDAQNSDRALEGPSLEHVMGTDALGRDVAARIAEGARISLVVAVGATLLAMLIGVGYGASSTSSTRSPTSSSSCF
jgi:ABC-type dipeptide/oligopeptide/nickel transport system permease subunit